MTSSEEARRSYRNSMNVRKGWITRKERMRGPRKTWCCCPVPNPVRGNLLMVSIGTVECGNCGRAIFDDEENPVRSVD